MGGTWEKVALLATWVALWPGTVAAQQPAPPEPGEADEGASDAGPPPVEPASPEEGGAPPAADRPAQGAGGAPDATPPAADRPAQGAGPEARTAGSAGDDVEEITVRARKREESLQTVPVAVTAFNRKQLERAAMRDLQDLEAMAPNVIIDLVPVTPGGGGLGIRGISFNDTEKSLDPAVGVVLDGVFIGTNTGQLLNNFDFESVEILRGPQGTLFGRNTTAGVINVRRTRPTGKWGLKASVTGGSFGRNDYKLVANLPTLGDVLSTKLSVYSLNMTGTIENTTPEGDAGRWSPAQHYLSGAVDLLFTPTDDLEILFKYERIYDRSTTIPFPSASGESHIVCYGPPLGLTTFSEPQCAPDDAPLNKVQSGFRDDSDFDVDAVTARVDWDLGDYSIVSVSGWRGHDEDVFQDFDGTFEDFFSTRRTQRYDQASEELRLHGNPVEGLNFVLGSYYFFGRYDINTTNFFLFDQRFIRSTLPPALESSPPGMVRIQDAGQTTHALAGFAQADYEVVEGLRLAAGARYTWEQKEFYNDWGLSNYLDPDVAKFLVDNDAEPGVQGAPKSWAKPTVKFGVDYQLPSRWMPGQGAMLYATYSTGFKSGGFNGRADPASLDTFEPEDVTQYEVGLKTDWFERRLFFNVAGFWTNYENKQEEVVIPTAMGGQQTVSFNASDATIRGVEIETSATPLRGLSDALEGLRLWGSVGLLDAKYERFFADLNPFDSVFEATDNSAFEMRYAPKLQLGAGLQAPYDWGDGRVYLYAQYRWRDDQRTSFTYAPGTTTPDDRGMAPAVGQLDGSINLELDDLARGKWRLSLFGRNIANEVQRAVYLDIGGLFAFQGPSGVALWGLELQAEY